MASFEEIDDELKDHETFCKIENIFKLLEKEEDIVLGEYKDVVLLLGNTGSGKSTLTQFIAGDSSQLTSIQMQKGKYNIIDDRKKIGHGIFSKTLLPELVIDPDSNTAYYDCPGFSDTRSATYDMASNYFNKKVIDHVKSVKLILTVSYPSVQVGVDRADFMKLIKHVTEFVKNIECFEKSIGLVVTKVDNEYIIEDDRPSLLTDADVLDNISNYFNLVKRDLESELKRSESNSELYRKAISLIDILLRGDYEQNGKKIALFRKPNKEGILSDIKVLQIEKETMRKMIEHNLSFTKKKDKDFGFTISDNYKNSVKEIFDKINHDINGDILATTKHIKQHYYDILIDFDDLYVMRTKIGIILQNLSEVLRHLKNCVTFKEFLIQYTNFITQLGIKSSFERMNGKYKFINFLQMVSDEIFKMAALEWTEPIKNLENFLEEWSDWFSFLVILYEDITNFSSFMKIQNKKDILLQQILEVNTSDSLQILLNTLEKNSLGDRIKNVQLDDVKIKLLHAIFSKVINNSIDFKYSEPSRLTITGDFIIFSDILKFLAQSQREMTYLKIFALHTVFVDEDFIKIGVKLRMFVISPRWEVIGDRKIVLDGAPGRSHEFQKAVLGEDGKPGLPGGTAGSFIGIGRNIINVGRLTITANGGNGGPGQDGGDGLPGMDAKTSEIPHGTRENGEEIINKSLHEKLSQSNKLDTKGVLRLVANGLGFNKYYNNTEYVIYGAEGAQGGNGFKCGSGGIGGLAGEIFLFGFDNESRIDQICLEGSNGVPGNGGKGGLGGNNFDDLYYQYEEINDYILHVMKVDTRQYQWNFIKSETKGRAPSGEDSMQTTHTNIDRPDVAITFVNPSYEISSYKIYLLQNSNDSINKHTVIEFYKHIEESTDIKNMYDSFGYLYELKIFETNFRQLHKHMNLTTVYKKLLKSISDYANQTKDYEKTQAHQKFLNYLYTATLSKIISLKTKSEGNIIINIERYFQQISNNFKIIKETVADIVKNEYNVSFKKKINLKNNDATHFIKMHIAPQIRSIIRQIDCKIENLLNEIMELKRNDERGALIKKLELERTLEKKESFSFLSMFCNILTVFTNVGRFVYVFTHTVCQVGKALGGHVTMNGTFSSIINIANKVKKGMDFAQEFFKNKIEALIDFVDKLFEEISECSDILKGIYSIATKLKNHLQILLSNMDGNNNTSLAPMITELKQELQKTVVILNEDNLNISNDLEVAKRKDLSRMLKFQNELVNVAEHNADIYLKYKDNKDKLRNCVQQSKITHHEYENTYKEILPLFTIIQNDISNLTNNLETGSQTTLDVTNWNIQMLFKDMISLLRKFKHQFKSQDDTGIECLIDKLEEAIHILITVYDRIQTYTEQKELADYIANINSAAFHHVTIDNPEIKDALVNLDYILKSNVVLGQFEKALDGFKHCVFPFAHFFFDEYELSQQDETDDLHSLIESATKKIDVLQEKLVTSNVMIIKELDCFTHQELSQGGQHLSGPFFVWDSEKYEKYITQILSGKEVILKANIMYGNQNKNAIKFNFIQINFKSVSSVTPDTLSKLNSFDVIMKHYGNSYYRFDNRFYILTTDSQTFYYSFKKDEKGKPARRNDAFKKLMGGPFILSPYATWSFRLKNVLGTSFTELDDLKGKVDLELIGRGQYVTPDNNLTANDLDQYYKSVESVSVTDKIELNDENN